MTRFHVISRVLAAATLALGAAGCDEDPTAAARLPDEARPAAETSSDRPATAAAPARITFVSRTHDFGRMSETERAQGAFSFTNTGGATLRIDDVKTTCGCTVPTLERRDYEPGESGAIGVLFDPAGPGSTKKYLNVITNAEPDPVVVLTIKAEVRPFVILEPDKLELGRLTFGRAHEATVSVSSVDPAFVIESVGTSNPHVTARVADGAGRAAGGPDAPRHERVEVRVEPDAPWGGLFAWLNITVVGRPEPGGDRIAHRARMRVQGQLFGDLVAEPDTFRFGVTPDQPFERRLRLERSSGGAFAVLETRIENATLAAPEIGAERVGDRAWVLVLTATGSPKAGRERGTVVVTTDVPGEERLEIPIVGVTRAADERSIRSP